MFLSKLIVLTSILFLVVACSGTSFNSTHPVASSDIAYYKGKYTITLLVSKNIYDMYINYDGSVQYKLSSDKSYTSISKSSVKYNSENKFFSLPFDTNKGSTFEIIFKDKDNMDVVILEPENKISDIGEGKRA